MRVLVACEESQRVCMAFRAKGHIAFSCDLKDCSGGFPQYHIKGDCRLVIESHSWDLLIAHPPCTYFSRVNFLNYYRNGVFNEQRFEKALESAKFFNYLLNCGIPRICVENPVPMSLFKDVLPPYDEKIQPYEFNEPYSKATCLWLRNLPLLIPTCHVLDYTPYVVLNGNLMDGRFDIAKRSEYRSKTFYGIAKAMAEQWDF